MATFTDRLKELRKSKNLTQVNVADAIGCVEQYYQKIEYGKIKPNYEVISKLADYFGVSADYLLGRENYWQDSDRAATKKEPTEE